MSIVRIAWYEDSWNGEDEQTGRLAHKPGGAEHARWVFD
jgi:hypothetical protein